TAEQVAAGIPFAEACRVLRQDYDSRERTWASYGDYDRRQFERQCTAWGVPNPFGQTHLNVKNLFALRHPLHHEVGTDAGLARLEIPLEGTHHRGGDDAWNIAAILARLLELGGN